jgi:hypothetical protein
MRASTSASMAVASTSRAAACASHARRVAGAAVRRDGCVVRAAMRRERHAGRGRSAWAVPRATARGGDDDADEPRRVEIDVPSEWRDGPEPASPFASLFERAAESGGGDDETRARAEGERLEDGEREERATRSETTEASPFCSISFIDESVDDGEGVFDAPMAGRESVTSENEPPGAPVAAWPPWLAEEVAATFDEAEERARAETRDDESSLSEVSPLFSEVPKAPKPARPAVVVESALVEVCAGKACAKKGSAEIHSAIAGAAPATWRCEQRRKCWGLCQAACVVRVTKGTAQTTHVRVTPATAVATVVTPDRPLGYVPRSNFVYERPREEFTKEQAAADETTRVSAAGPSLPWKPPASFGLMAAAAAAVEKGVVDPVAREKLAPETDEAKTDRREAKQKAVRPGLTRAKRASERAATVFGGAAEYGFESTNRKGDT